MLLLKESINREDVIHSSTEKCVYRGFKRHYFKLNVLKRFHPNLTKIILLMIMYVISSTKNSSGVAHFMK